MTPPRNSPLTVQDEGLNGMTNGHIDHHTGRIEHPPMYSGRARQRMHQLPCSYQAYDGHHSFGYPSDPTPYSYR